jgi:hypothetical protein
MRKGAGHGSALLFCKIEDQRGRVKSVEMW